MSFFLNNILSVLGLFALSQNQTTYIYCQSTPLTQQYTHSHSLSLFNFFAFPLRNIRVVINCLVTSVISQLTVAELLVLVSNTFSTLAIYMQLINKCTAYWVLHSFNTVNYFFSLLLLIVVYNYNTQKRKNVNYNFFFSRNFIAYHIRKIQTTKIHNFRLITPFYRFFANGITLHDQISIPPIGL